MYPLTTGLLVSMAMRHNHSFGIDKVEPIDNDFASTLMGLIGFTNAERCALLIELAHVYYQYQHKPEEVDRDRWKQVIEEINGSGFYKPELEEEYNNRCPNNIKIENGLLTYIP